jgi:hypothetical protein
MVNPPPSASQVMGTTGIQVANVSANGSLHEKPRMPSTGKSARASSTES